MSAPSDEAPSGPRTATRVFLDCAPHREQSLNFEGAWRPSDLTTKGEACILET